MPVESEQPIRKRILDATFAVVSRTGRKKLQLLEVAVEAGVSRPTVYRYFGSKEGLLEAFALFEQDNFNAGVAAATAGLRGPDRVDAALQFIVDHQFSHSLAQLVDMEPEYSLSQMMRVLPTMQEGMRHIMVGDNPDIAAAATFWPVNPVWALLSDQPSCYAGPQSVVAYGAVTRPQLAAIDQRFARVFSGHPAPGDVSAMARDDDCRFALVTIKDGAWQANGFVASPDYMRIAEGDGWRLYQRSFR